MLLQTGPVLVAATPNTAKVCCCSENSNHSNHSNHINPTEEVSNQKSTFAYPTCHQQDISSVINKVCGILLGAIADGCVKPALVRHLRRWEACRRSSRRRKGGGAKENLYKNNKSNMRTCNKQARVLRTRTAHVTTTRDRIEKRKLRKRVTSILATSNCSNAALAARLLLADYNDSGMLQARNSNCLRARTRTTAGTRVAMESSRAPNAVSGLRSARTATATTTTKVTRLLSRLVKCECPIKQSKLATAAAEQQPTPLASLHQQQQRALSRAAVTTAEAGFQVDGARILRADSSDKHAGVPLEQQLIAREFHYKQEQQHHKQQHCLHQLSTAVAQQRPAAKVNYLQHRGWRNLIGCVTNTHATTTAIVINTITAMTANVITTAPTTTTTTTTTKTIKSVPNCNAHCSSVSDVATKMSTTAALSAKQDVAKATTKCVCVETTNISAQRHVVPCVIARESKCRSTVALRSALTVMVKTAATATTKQAIQPVKSTKRDKPTQIKLARSKTTTITTKTLFGNIFTLLVGFLTLHATVLRCLLFTALTAATATVTAAPFVAQNSLLLLSQQMLRQHSPNNNSSNSSTSPSTSAQNHNHRHTMLPATLASPATQAPPLPPPIRNRMMDIEVLNSSSYTGTLKSLSSTIEDAESGLGDVNQLPIFDFGLPRNITARTGQAEAAIKCRVERLDDKSVSWIRKRDLHILTVATATYTSDKRFQVTSSKDGREWTLHVKSPQARDTGIYECQVNTEPKMSMAFQLNIIEIPADSRAIISGPADLHFKVGSAIILSCHVQQPSVRDIGPIYWYRGDHIITPFELDEDEESDSANKIRNNNNRHSHGNGGGGGDMATPALMRNELAADVTAAITNANALTAAGGSSAMAATALHDGLSNDITPDFTARIAMESQLGDTMKSRLRISNAQTTDTGNYTCQPTTASSASVMVHVINDENPAAMQKSCASLMRITTTTMRRTSTSLGALLLLAAITTIIVETLMTGANTITRTTKVTMAIIATITTLLLTYLVGVSTQQQQQLQQQQQQQQFTLQEAHKVNWHWQQQQQMQQQQRKL